MVKLNLIRIIISLDCIFSVVAVLKLSEIERHLCNKGLFEYISVQVAVTLTWFIRRLAANYLGFDEQSYKDGNIQFIGLKIFDNKNNVFS
jgi:hypothetical protein